MTNIINEINFIFNEIKDLTEESSSFEMVKYLDYIWGELDRLNNLAEARMCIMLAAKQNLPEIKLADKPQWLDDLLNNFNLSCIDNGKSFDNHNMKCAEKLILAALFELEARNIKKSDYEIELELFPFNVILVNWNIETDVLNRMIYWSIDRSNVNWPGVNIKTYLSNKDRLKFNMSAQSFHTVFSVIDQFVNVLENK